MSVKQPADWVRDSSSSANIFHPGTSTGDGGSDGKLYALAMSISDSTLSTAAPSTFTAEERAQALAYIDQVSQDASKILPTQSESGCDDAPQLEGTVDKMTVHNAFFAYKYRFSCKNPNSSDKIEFVAAYVASDNADEQHIVYVLTASEDNYEKNKTKIDEIFASITF